MMDPEQYVDAPVHYSCRKCQRPLHSLEFDGEHEDCEFHKQLDRIRQRDAQRQLHRHTALLLRKLGFPEEAAKQDVLAEGRW